MTKNRREYYQLTTLEVLEEIIKNAIDSVGVDNLVKWMDTPLEDPDFNGLTPAAILGNTDEHMLLLHTREMGR